jgi:thiosulfate reductase cytochrome b subunit
MVSNNNNFTPEAKKMLKRYLTFFSIIISIIIVSGILMVYSQHLGEPWISIIMFVYGSGYIAFFIFLILMFAGKI